MIFYVVMCNMFFYYTGPGTGRPGSGRPCSAFSREGSFTPMITSPTGSDRYKT